MSSQWYRSDESALTEQPIHRGSSTNNLVNLSPPLIRSINGHSSSTGNLHDPDEPQHGGGVFVHYPIQSNYLDPGFETFPTAMPYIQLNSASSSDANSTCDVVTQMGNRESNYVDLHDLKIFAGTFNVNGVSPKSHSLAEWLTKSCKNGNPDIYCLGFQELDLNPAIYVLDNTPREDEWAKACADAIRKLRGDDYFEIKTPNRNRVAGIMMLIFVKNSCRPFISDVLFKIKTTGAMANTIGNKGGVGTSFRYRDSWICFINSHLAAHDNEVEKRNMHYKLISDAMFFDHQPHHPIPLELLQHDIVIWIGDLNYRLDRSNVLLDRRQVIAWSVNNQYENLLRCDQLNKMRLQLGRAFQYYAEGNISFGPTFKYDIGTTVFDTSEKARVPAYCDRILFYSKPRNHIELLQYNSVPELTLSDHKPVFAEFKCQVKVVDMKRFGNCFKLLQDESDRSFNDQQPKHQIYPIPRPPDMVTWVEALLDFGEVHYGDERVCMGVTLSNIGTAPFIYKLKNDKIHAMHEWITVKPASRLAVLPDTSITLSFEVQVHLGAAWIIIRQYKRNHGDSFPPVGTRIKIDQFCILLMARSQKYIQNGDPQTQACSAFVQCSAIYVVSCYGSSLVDLAATSTGSGDDDNVPTGPTKLSKPREYRFVPDQLYKLVHCISHRDRITTKGIFQNDSGESEFASIRQALDENREIPPSTSTFGVCYALIALINAFLDPIFISTTLHDAISAGLSKNKQQALAITARLPEAHRQSFFLILRLLDSLLMHSEENGIDIDYLLTFFVQTLFRVKLVDEKSKSSKKTGHLQAEGNEFSKKDSQSQFKGLINFVCLLMTHSLAVSHIHDR